MDMIHSTFKFINVAFGSVKRRRHVIAIENLQLPEDRIECYRTALRFDRSYLEYWQSNGKSVRGFRGCCCADFVFIDIDAPDPAISLERAHHFLLYLEQQYDVPIDSVRMYFSGCKGFHIEIPVSLLGGVEPSKNLPRRIKNFVFSLGDWTFDGRIYNHNRLWRIVNTINIKSGLYKIRLTPSELLDLSIEEIKARAKGPVPLDVFANSGDWLPIPGFHELWHRPKSVRRTWESAFKIAQIKGLDFLREGVNKGERNDTLFLHAKRLRAIGHKQPKVDEILLDWNQKNTPPLEDREVRSTIKSVFSYKGKSLDPYNVLDSLRGSFLYQNLNAAQRDVLITAISRAWKVAGEYVDAHKNRYHLEPGDLLFSYRGFATDCAKNVQEASVRSAIAKLLEAGLVELITLGGKRLSILRFVGFNTQPADKSITHDSKV